MYRFFNYLYDFKDPYCFIFNSYYEGFLKLFSFKTAALILYQRLNYSLFSVG